MWPFTRSKATRHLFSVRWNAADGHASQAPAIQQRVLAVTSALPVTPIETTVEREHVTFSGYIEEANVDVAWEVLCKFAYLVAREFGLKEMGGIIGSELRHLIFAPPETPQAKRLPFTLEMDFASNPDAVKAFEIEASIRSAFTSPPFAELTVQAASSHVTVNGVLDAPDVGHAFPLIAQASFAVWTEVSPKADMSMMVAGERRVMRHRAT
jgi:hypothetical protein